MSYPIFNLESNYQDINADNADIVGRYITLLWNTINKTTDEISQKIPTFNDVSQYYTANETTLERVIFNAETVNGIIDYLKDLKNYTINSKNQLFFISEGELNSEYFNTLNATLVEGDVIVVTSNESRRVIKSFKQKQSDGSYQVVGTIVSNNNYVECTQIVSSTAYVTSSNSEILYKDGDDIFIRFVNVSKNLNSELYLNINGQVYDDIVFRDSSVFWKDIYKDSTYHFILNYNYNENGNAVNSRLEMINPVKDDTGWINCFIDNTSTTPYKSTTYPQVRKIGDVVHMRGAIKNNKPFRNLRFSLPSQIFFPEKEEYFVQHTLRLDDDTYVYDITTPSLIDLRIKENGEVSIASLTSDTMIDNDIALNCEATWFVN